MFFSSSLVQQQQLLWDGCSALRQNTHNRRRGLLQAGKQGSKHEKEKSKERWEEIVRFPNPLSSRGGPCLGGKEARRQEKEKSKTMWEEGERILG